MADRSQTAGESGEELVTVAHFGSEAAYMMARSRLDSAGIESFAQNLHAFRSVHGGVFGGIELQVRESEAQDALAILADAGEAAESG